MALEIEQKQEEKGTIINFNKEDHKVVDIKGNLYVLHYIHADKLIKSKKAKEVKNVTLNEPEKNKTVKDIKNK